MSFRMIFFIYAGLGLLELLSTFFLSTRCELPKAERGIVAVGGSSETSPLLGNDSENGLAPTKKPLIPPMSRETTIVITKLCLLFSIDSIASGLVPR